MLSQRIRKCYYKTLGTCLINSPLSPLSLIIATQVNWSSLKLLTNSPSLSSLSLWDALVCLKFDLDLRDHEYLAKAVQIM